MARSDSRRLIFRSFWRVYPNSKLLPLILYASNCKFSSAWNINIMCNVLLILFYIQVMISINKFSSQFHKCKLVVCVGTEWITQFIEFQPIQPMEYINLFQSIVFRYLLAAFKRYMCVCVCAAIAYLWCARMLLVNSISTQNPNCSLRMHLCVLNINNY